MEITEEDIFKYVLFPDEIEIGKKEFIHANENLFSGQIEFCQAFLQASSNEEINIQSKNAVARIFSRIKVIELLPFINKKLPRNNTLTFAAATTEVANKQSESITYTDENSKYLVRVISNNDKNTLYFFSKDKNQQQKLKLTLIPSNEIYHITNNFITKEL